MLPGRVHITGASGTGTTTLGRELATGWSIPHADVDDYFWLPTHPPYTDKRLVHDRLALMQKLFVPRASWVLSGRLGEWAAPITTCLDAVVFLTLDPTTRLARLTAREQAREASLEQHQAFMDWARGYDDPEFAGRSRKRHEAWLSQITCPILRLDSAQPTAQLVAAVLSWAPTEAC